MANKRTAAILGAGLGSRLQGLTHAKPLLAIRGQTLLQRLILQLAQQGFERIVVVLRDELLSDSDRAALPRPRGVEYSFVNTPSSLHTLVAAIDAASVGSEPLFVSMVDTVVKPMDLFGFSEFCKIVPPGSSALLGTTYIDDEKPLYVKATSHGRVLGVGSEPTPVVTAGMYYLSQAAQDEARKQVAAGTEKMRNFLSSLITTGQSVNLFVVEKTLDVDRPEDLAQAEQFV